MKKIWKRALALLCTLSMVAGGILTWNNQEAKAAEFTPVDLMGTVNWGAGYLSRQDCTLQIANAQQAANLCVEMSFTLSAAMAGVMQADDDGELEVYLCQGWLKNGYKWSVPVNTMQESNTLTLKLSEAEVIGTIDYSATFINFQVTYLQTENDTTSYHGALNSHFTYTALQVKEIEEVVFTPTDFLDKMENSNGSIRTAQNFSVMIPDATTAANICVDVSFDVSAGLTAVMQDDPDGEVEILFCQQYTKSGYRWTIDAEQMQTSNTLSLKLSEAEIIDASGVVSTTCEIDYSQPFTCFHWRYFQTADDASTLHGQLATHITFTKLQVNEIEKLVFKPMDLTGTVNFGGNVVSAQEFSLQIADATQAATLCVDAEFKLSAGIASVMQADTDGEIVLELCQGWLKNGYQWIIDANTMKETNTLSLKLSEATVIGEIDFSKPFINFHWRYFQTAGDSTTAHGALNQHFLGYTKLQVNEIEEQQEVVDTEPIIQEYKGISDINISGINNGGSSWNAQELNIMIADQTEANALSLDTTFTLTPAMAAVMKEDSDGELEFFFCQGWFNNGYKWNVKVNSLDETNTLSLKLSEASIIGAIDYSAAFNNILVRYIQTAGDDTTKHGQLTSHFTYTSLQVVPEKIPQAGAAPTDVPEDYIFAGWYTDEACTTANALEGVANGKVYAKFVRKGILNVKAQKAVDNNATDNKGILRFVSTVDSLQYREVGFVITVNGSTEQALTSTEVYSELYAIGNITYKPTDIDAASLYFNAITFRGVPTDTDLNITVKAYWITQDGTTVYGDERALPTINIVSQ